MKNLVQVSKPHQTARNNLIREIKLSVNRRLYNKKLITEDMYQAARELLERQLTPPEV